MFCKYCGKPHNDGDQFCPYCGQALNSTSNPNQTVNTSPSGSFVNQTYAVESSRLSSYSNPTFRESVFGKMAATGKTMTMRGALNKTIILLAVLLFGALASWTMGFVMWGSVIALSIIAFVVCLVVSFVPKTAPYLSIVYALFEGLALGALSNCLNHLYPGIAAQAVVDTIVIAGAMLFFYRTGLIQVTDRFKSIVISATVGIVLAQLLIFVLHLFGFNVPYIFDGGWLSIIIGLVIVGVAAFNLALDFQFFKDGEEAQLPSYCEWYAGFGLLTTLVWLYVSILRLLSILDDN